MTGSVFRHNWLTGQRSHFLSIGGIMAANSLLLGTSSLTASRLLAGFYMEWASLTAMGTGRGPRPKNPLLSLAKMALSNSYLRWSRMGRSGALIMLRQDLPSATRCSLLEDLSTDRFADTRRSLFRNSMSPPTPYPASVVNLDRSLLRSRSTIAPRTGWR